MFIVADLKHFLAQNGM